jgi:acetylornithine deacetylase/succinyl-diaminopimelate desuccinylase-like protein
MAESDAPQIVSDWLDIAAVAAPLGAEHDRAEMIAHKLSGIPALADVEVSSGPDAEGPNVYARLPGTGGGRTLAVISTLDDLDTIAALRQQPGMRLGRDGDRLVGPCVTTAAISASGIATARQLDAAGWQPAGDVVFAWVSGEETGLTGMRRFIETRRADADAVIELLAGIGLVSFGAIGAEQLEIRLTAEPSHSLSGGPAAITEALARIILAVRELAPEPDRDEHWSVLRVNTVHAGSVLNHSPADGMLTVDIRSTDAAWRVAVTEQVGAIAARLAADCDAVAQIRTLRSSPPVSLPGGRDNPLVTAAAAAIAATGHEPVIRPWSSSNVNVAIEAGIPGVAMEGSTRGGDRGTDHEWCGISGVITGVAASAALINQVSTMLMP